MIGLDTNVVIRLLIEDDPKQVARALELLEPRWERGEAAFLPDVVLAEVEWVLEGAYRVPRREILAALQAIAGDPRFAVEDQVRLSEALRRYQEGRGDLSDYLVGLAAQERGAEATVTFDRSLRDEPGFLVL